MKIALAIFKYFPHGGLQRDMMRIAREAAGRGHRVTIYAAVWRDDAPLPNGVETILLPVRAWSNHKKILQFERAFAAAVATEDFDVKAVFNRMSGGDFYFAADNALGVEMPRKHGRLVLSILPRYHTLLDMERKLFSPQNNCRIWYLTARQKADYQSLYHTPESRFRLLPPGMNDSCVRPADAAGQRERTRAALGVGKDTVMLILVGSSDFFVKGGDRAVRALSSLPGEVRRNCVLFIIGAADKSGLKKLCARLKVAEQVRFTGGCNDVPELLLAADLMVHPARNEATGTVLIESLAMGTPAIASGVCGFANYAAELSPELVVPEPFEQAALDRILAGAIARRAELRTAAAAYAAKVDFHRRAAAAVDDMQGAVKR